MADHGKLFDRFTGQASHDHGGSYFDSGFSLQSKVNTHGRLHDLFGVPKDSSAHGGRFDEFGWRDMPAVHGTFFDSDFQQPTSHAGEHGTWFDEFRGGTQVRYMFDGGDYEGTVVDVNREYATVQSQDGQSHEVGLSQFLAYRTPNESQASPELPQAERSGPSADDPTAAGHATGTEPTSPALTAEPSVIQHVGPGPGNTDSRSTPEGLFATFDHLVKTADRELDVTKDVDATETAAQSQDLEGDAKHAWCPHCEHECKKPTKEGTCPTCGTKVSIGKTDNGTGIDVPERPHKSTDHHTSGRKPGRCPHCGGVISDLDAIADQGAPTHKCMAGALDVLKALTESTEVAKATFHGASCATCGGNVYAHGVHQVTHRDGSVINPKPQAGSPSRAGMGGSHVTCLNCGSVRHAGDVKPFTAAKGPRPTPGSLRMQAKAGGRPV